MRPLALFLTLFAIVAAGCGGSEPQGVATYSPTGTTGSDGAVVEASCIAGFNWNGRFYARDGGELEQPVEIGGELGQGVEPGCNDTGEGAEPNQEVTVLRIKGVDPEVAVARQGDDHPYFNVIPAP